MRFLVFFLLFLPCAVTAANQNLVLITIDTLRADHLGCYGNKKVRTPHLDAIAGESLIFENAVSPAPLTLPSHTTLLTGRNPYHHGVRDNAGSVNPKEVTLAEILRQKGFHTYAFVSGFPLEHRFGLNQGFELYDDAFPREKNGSLDFHSERTADATVKAVMNSGLSEPFFLWVHFYDPHAPYKNGGYEGEINFVDQQVGILLKKITMQNTIVAVAGDHGESLGEHGEMTHRIFIYDSTMKVPFFIRIPGQPPRKVKTQAGLVDFLPTILSFMKISVPAGIDGVVVPTQPGQEAHIESMFPALQLGWSPLSGIRTEEWKYIQAPHPELYHLPSDPQEKRNVISNQPEIAKKLRAKIPNAAVQNSQSVEMTPEMAEELAALGYVSGKSTTPNGTIDPKDRIQVWNQIERAVDSESSDPAQTISILENALKQDPGNFMILSFLAEEYADANRLTEAKRLLNDLLKRDPQNTLALSRMANVCLKNQQPEEAKKWATILLKSGNWETDAQILLARANMKLGDTKAAAESLKRVLELDPRDQGSRIDLANLYLQGNQPGLARKEFQRALKVNPKDLQALNGMATCDFLANNFQSAERILQTAIQSDPKDIQTKMNLALVYSKQGKVKDAIALYREVESSSNAPEDWKSEARNRIQELQH